MSKLFAAALAFGATLALGCAAEAQRLPNLYGLPIGVADARKAIAAAEAESVKNGWLMACAVVDPAGILVAYEKMDGTQNAAARIAIAKARAAALFKRPTKALEDVLAGGRMAILGLPGAVPVEGGLPILAQDQIVGAMGCSGGASAQDAQVARAGLEAIK